MRILITGASGSGTTTLGRALSRALDAPFFDVDDYYWLATDPPFQKKRDATARLALLLSDLEKSTTAVVAGSVMDWGCEVEDCFSLIVYLTLDAELRVARLRQREIALLGDADEEFLEWAKQYDEGHLPGRSRARHEAWLSHRSCPVLRIDGDLTVHERLARVSATTERLRTQHE